jgi:hypothetical protein
VCFYNGTAEKEDIIIQKLSDSFLEGLKPDIEVKVTMININYGHNKTLLDACSPLKEYAMFVESVRNNRSRYVTLEEAVDAAVDELPEGSAIKSFLIANKAEVKQMCITEYDEARTFEEQLQEGIVIGEKIGEERGIKLGSEKANLSTAAALINMGLLSLENIALATGLPLSKVEELAQMKN